MVYIKEFHKSEYEIIKIDNRSDAEKYLKQADGDKFYIYYNDENYKNNAPDELVFNMQVEQYEYDDEEDE